MKSTVYAIKPLADGKILVGADGFTGRLFDYGAYDYSFYFPNSPGPVSALVVQPDGKLLIGSTSRAPLEVPYLARFQPDGSPDAAFQPVLRLTVDVLGPHAFVNAIALHAIALQADSKILVGGAFSQVGSQPWTNLVRLYPDGTLDTTFKPAIRNDLKDDGKILVGTAYGASLIRLNSDGTWDGNFEVDVDGMWGVVAIALDQKGNVLVSAQLSRQPLTLSRRFGGEPAPTAPIFERQPLQWPLSGGNAVALAPLITAFPLPSYQWEFNGENLPGATHSVLVVTNRPTSAGSYQLRVSNSLGSVVSDPVVIGLPVIVEQPSSQAALPTQQMEFSVTATSVLPLFYQWQFNEQDLPGQTNSTLVLADVQPPQAGVYTVIVSNFGGAITSGPAALTVLPVPPPEILVQPSPQIVLPGLQAEFTVVATNALALSYQWTREGLALPGQTNSTLVLANVQPVQAGTYTVVVSSVGGSITSQPTALTVLPMIAPEILIQPLAQAVQEDDPVSFYVSATNYLPLSFQWQLNSTNIPGATQPTYHLRDALPANAGVYRVTVSSPFLSTTSEVAVLTVTPIPVISGPGYVSGRDQASLEAALAQTDVVLFGIGGYLTITNTLVITRDTTLDGTGRKVTLDGGNLTRHFVVTNGATLRLINLTLANGRLAGAQGDPGLGGSIYIAGGALDLTGCQFINNQVIGGQGRP